MDLHSEPVDGGKRNGESEEGEKKEGEKTTKREGEREEEVQDAFSARIVIHEALHLPTRRLESRYVSVILVDTSHH